MEKTNDDVSPIQKDQEKKRALVNKKQSQRKQSRRKGSVAIPTRVINVNNMHEGQKKPKRNQIVNKTREREEKGINRKKDPKPIGSNQNNTGQIFARDIRWKSKKKRNMHDETAFNFSNLIRFGRADWDDQFMKTMHGRI